MNEYVAGILLAVIVCQSLLLARLFGKVKTIEKDLYGETKNTNHKT